MTREYTNKLYDLLDDGVLDDRTVLEACLAYMSEQQVKDMAESNDLIPEDEEEGEE